MIINMAQAAIYISLYIEQQISFLLKNIVYTFIVYTYFTHYKRRIKNIDQQAW